MYSNLKCKLEVNLVFFHLCIISKFNTKFLTIEMLILELDKSIYIYI